MNNNSNNLEASKEIVISVLEKGGSIKSLMDIFEIRNGDKKLFLKYAEQIVYVLNNGIKEINDENGIAPTANTCNGGATEGKIAQKIGIINSGEQYYAIRRLTPHEYIRLMGFPDYAYSRFKDAGLSDSTIYHLAGDSIVVQVLMCIFGELLGIDYDYLLDESIEKARGK